MNDLSIVFENNPIRNVFQNEEWWFCAKDVCSALEIKRHRDAITGLEESQRERFPLDTLGGQQLTTFVSEDGLYELIFKSNKPEAKKFKTYVFELVKAHRKGEVLTLEQHKAELEKRIARLNAENLQLIQHVATTDETLQVVESMFDTGGCMEMKDAVKVLKEYFCDEGSSLVGRNKLFAFLRDSEVLMSNNTPYQDYAKHFVVNPTTQTIHLKNKSLVWLKKFVSKRVPKKASILQIAHARKGFDLHVPE